MVIFPAALESLLSSKLLSEDQGIRLKILNLLCQWLGLGSTRMTGLASGRTEHPPAEVMRFLQNLLDESTWDPARAYDLQLVSNLFICQAHSIWYTRGISADISTT